MTRLLAISIVATFAHTALATPVVFSVHFEFEFDNGPELPAVVTGTITADPATDSVIETDLFLLGSIYTPDRPKSVSWESIGDGWEVTDMELSLRQDASNSEWKFRAYFYCGPHGGCGHGWVRPHYDYYFELLPEGHSNDFQAILTERYFSGGGGGGEELVAAHSDSSSSGRHAHLQLPINSSGTGFLIGTAIPEPSSLALLMLGLIANCRASCFSCVKSR